MFSIYLVLGIGCSHAKFNQSKGLEGEIGARSENKANTVVPNVLPAINTS